MTPQVIIQNPPDMGENHYISPVYVTLLNAITSFTNLCLGGTTMCALTFIHSNSARTSLKQHVYLCVIGYIILMTQAIHSLNPHSGWARMVKHQNRKMIHWTLQIVGAMLVTVGSIIRMIDMRSNFTSTHGILGIIALICTILSMVGGIINANSGRLNLNMYYIKVSHSCLGSLTLCFAFLSLCFAFDRVYRFSMGNKSADIAIALTVFGLVGTLVSPCLDIIKRRSYNCNRGRGRHPKRRDK